MGWSRGVRGALVARLAVRAAHTALFPAAGAVSRVPLPAVVSLHLSRRPELVASLAASTATAIRIDPPAGALVETGLAPAAQAARQALERLAAQVVLELHVFTVDAAGAEYWARRGEAVFGNQVCLVDPEEVVLSAVPLDLSRTLARLMPRLRDEMWTSCGCVYVDGAVYSPLEACTGKLHQWLSTLLQHHSRARLVDLIPEGLAEALRDTGFADTMSILTGMDVLVTANRVVANGFTEQLMQTGMEVVGAALTEWKRCHAVVPADNQLVTRLTRGGRLLNSGSKMLGMGPRPPWTLQGTKHGLVVIGSLPKLRDELVSRINVLAGGSTATVVVERRRFFAALSSPEKLASWAQQAGCTVAFDRPVDAVYSRSRRSGATTLSLALTGDSLVAERLEQKMSRAAAHSATVDVNHTVGRCISERPASLSYSLGALERKHKVTVFRDEGLSCTQFVVVGSDRAAVDAAVAWIDREAVRLATNHAVVSTRPDKQVAFHKGCELVVVRQKDACHLHVYARFGNLAAATKHYVDTYGGRVVL